MLTLGSHVLSVYPANCEVIQDEAKHLLLIWNIHIIIIVLKKTFAFIFIVLDAKVFST